MIRSSIAIAFGGLLSLASGCGVLPALVSVDSGITGIVQAGPTCPVIMSGQGCPDRPIVATIVVRSADLGVEVIRFASNTDGTFRVPLLPGRYVIDPQPDSGYAGPAAKQTIEVQALNYTNVILEYDTGIR